MKIVFIKPNMIAGAPSDSMEPSVFATLSALTPPHIERCFYDERLEKLPNHEPVDLVALTADTFSAKRAYQIANRYRRRGIPVIIGGFHPSMCPDEATQHADSIVIGDAEDTWPQLIADAEKKTLQPKYISAYPSLGEIDPDRSVFLGKPYAPVTLVEFNRGCRFACDFCSIRAMYSGRVRRHSLQYVLRNIDKTGKKYFLFTDDNLLADIPSLTNILHELAQRRLWWSCQISSDIAKHPDLVSLMGRAGCVSVTIGFESLDRENLAQMHKSWMEDNYKQVIRMFQDNGIMVYGTFILGYDHDTPDVFDRTLNFALEQCLALANFNPLFPTPGTSLYVRLQSQGRLLFDRWWMHSNYRWGDCVFRPIHMTPEQLADGCYRIRKEFNRNRSIFARFPGLDLRKTNPRKAALFVIANLLSRRELARKYGRALGDSSPANEPSLKAEDTVECI